MMRITRPVLATILAMLGSAGSTAPSSAGEPTYAVAEIGSIVAPGDLSFTTALNDDGDAVGEAWITGGRVPFIYTYEHGPQLLPLLAGFPSTRAIDVSERDAAGIITIAGTGAVSFFLDESDIGGWWRYDTTRGVVVDSGTIAPLPGFARSTIVAVDNSGRLVGQSNDPGFQPMVFDMATGVTTPFSFPAPIVDMNNLGQVAGGTFVGDLSGAFVNVGTPPTASGASITGINDHGDVSAIAHMPFTDGAGFFVNGIARRIDGTWQLIAAFSRFDGASEINSAGDLVGVLGASGQINPVVFFDDPGSLHLLNDLIDPMEQTIASDVEALNDRGQLGIGGTAAVLTPLGTMIIPGDVNGDAEVGFDDLCDFLASPIDLDGDGDADADDEQWLVDRLAVLGLIVADCNGNGTPDACDIADGTAADCDGNGVPDTCDPDCSGDGIPDACEPDCNGNGTPDPCDIASGSSDDCNGNGTPDECDGSETIVAGFTYDPPRPLFQGVPFLDSVLLPDPGVIEDVDFAVDLDYRIGNVTILLHHAGATAVLVDRPGHPANPSGFSNLGYRIVLDDEGPGPSIQTVGATCCEFSAIESPPAYRPNESLEVFDGLPREGIWTIEFIGEVPQHFDPKMLAWSVTVTDEAVAPEPCPCPLDLDGSGAVDLADLVSLLAAWGPCPDCPADFDGDDMVGLGDLLAVLAAWGDC